MKRRITIYLLGLALCIGYAACKKSDNSSPGGNNNNNGIAANTFKMDDTLTATTPSNVTSVYADYMSAIFSITLSGGSASDRVGVFFLHKPTASGTYKVHHVYPASNLAANEAFIDVNYAGCNYVTSDTSQTITVTVSGSTVNVQFTNLNYTFNNWIVLGNPTPRDPGKISGNVNFQ